MITGPHTFGWTPGCTWWTWPSLTWWCASLPYQSHLSMPSLVTGHSGRQHAGYYQLLRSVSCRLKQFKSIQAAGEQAGAEHSMKWNMYWWGYLKSLESQRIFVFISELGEWMNCHKWIQNLACYWKSEYHRPVSWVGWILYRWNQNLFWSQI